MAHVDPQRGNGMEAEGRNARPDGLAASAARPRRRRVGAGAALVTRLLLLLAAAVVLARAGRFVAAGVQLDAHDERTWLAWAWRDPGLGGGLERIRGRLAPGERIALVLPPDADPVWTGVMVLYHLPEQELVDVRRGRSDRPLPPGATVVRIVRDGTMRIRRPGDGP